MPAIALVTVCMFERVRASASESQLVPAGPGKFRLLHSRRSTQRRDRSRWASGNEALLVRTCVKLLLTCSRLYVGNTFRSVLVCFTLIVLL